MLYTLLHVQYKYLISRVSKGFSQISEKEKE